MPALILRVLLLAAVLLHRRGAAGYPAGLPRRYRRLWSKPWARRARYVWGFRKWLQAHGYLTPHFTLAEAASKDGVPIPRSMLAAARNHAFNLEQVRHATGDRPVPILSFYRSPARNAAVGGAKSSWHMKAVATDHPKSWADSVRYAGLVGERACDALAERFFSNGGYGDYPGGSVHFDSRGFRARWTSF